MTSTAIDPAVAFDDVMKEFLKRLQAWLRKASSVTKVVLVPSTDDVVHPTPCFPQTSIDLSWFGGVKAQMKDRIVVASNPCVLSLSQASGNEGEVVVGVANIDAPKHFMDDGSPSAGYPFTENFQRLSSHLLAQRSFYPMAPASAEAMVDASLRGRVEVPPLDLLVMSSMMHPHAAAEAVGGVLAVNAGRGLTGKAKLSVAKVHIPSASESQSLSLDAAASMSSGGAVGSSLSATSSGSASSLAKRARVDFDTIEIRANTLSSLSSS